MANWCVFILCSDMQIESTSNVDKVLSISQYTEDEVDIGIPFGLQQNKRNVFVGLGSLKERPTKKSCEKNVGGSLCDSMLFDGWYMSGSGFIFFFYA